MDCNKVVKFDGVHPHAVSSTGKDEYVCWEDTSLIKECGVGREFGRMALEGDSVIEWIL